MAPRMEDVMRLYCEISADAKMVAGGSAFVGGLLGGPPGLSFGEAVDSPFDAWLNSGEFRPVPQILKELPPNQKQILYNYIMPVLGSLDWTNAAQLIAHVMGNTILLEQVTAALLDYITKELRAQVRYKN